MLSINKLAYKWAKKLIKAPEYYRVKVEKLPSGATVIDTGIEAHGGYEAGLMATRIAMGRAEDALTYGGVTTYVVDEPEDSLKEFAEKAPSSNCSDYGKTSYDIYKAVNFDFTKVDPALFAPAEITLTCAKTGTTFHCGEINYDLIQRSALE